MTMQTMFSQLQALFVEMENFREWRRRIDERLLAAEATLEVSQAQAQANVIARSRPSGRPAAKRKV